LVSILINFSVKLERILKLLQGIIVNGACAVVGKSAAQQHSQGKNPQVILRVTLENILGQVSISLFIRY
jgi:hypothetical protein